MRGLSHSIGLSNRSISILIGLYLSKFDEEGLTKLGFSKFTEAYNTLGYSIGTKPASLKNYRDEFDPIFPNLRKGRRNRPMRDYCKEIFDRFGNLNIEDFTDLIQSCLIPNYEIEKVIKPKELWDKSESVAKRLMTGKAAEEYFKMNFSSIREFTGFSLKDTTNLACGFDFKLSRESNFYCAEVKGLSASTGGISLTEKEYGVAEELKERYCLFVVSNFIEKPKHQVIFNPIESNLSFKKLERQIMQVTYATSI
jgi:hypothetical protein